MKNHTRPFFCLVVLFTLFCSATCLTGIIETAAAAQSVFTCVEHTATNAEHETAGRAESYYQLSGCDGVTLFRAVGSGDALGEAGIATTLAEYPEGYYGNRGCAVCGDGVTEMSEACDDGNTGDGDGCSSECMLECTATASDDVTCDGVDDDCDGQIDEDGDCSSSVDCTLNPYAGVNWSTWNQVKANFHTHTTESDGDQAPATVIDEYHSAGYGILAITDHNTITWPWTDFGRDPGTLGMLAVRGDEYSMSNHINAFYNFSSAISSLELGMAHVASNGGFTHINHPGRYKTPSDWSWYISLFSEYPSCVGMEVYNQGDRYPDDRRLWDNINENYFPDTGKMVWGYSNDDKHSKSHLYRNFQFMLVPELTESALRTSQQSGAFYFCYEPGGSGDADVPRISSITVDNAAKTIVITASGYNTISWVGPGTTSVATGATFDFSDYESMPFARAVLNGINGDCLTQPFGFAVMHKAQVGDF